MPDPKDNETGPKPKTTTTTTTTTEKPKGGNKLNSFGPDETGLFPVTT
jgi:hypothetical protein